MFKDSVTVLIGTIPVAAFGYLPSLSCEGMTIQFVDSSLNTLSWLWNFGDGNTSVQQDPVHAFPYNNTYYVTLVAFNPPCSDTATQIISVNEQESYVAIQTANVFTPNYDGINDCFNLSLNASFEGCAELSIYDRWGVGVYHSSYSGACWDGRNSVGVLMPAGTYFYIFDLNGIQKKGFITLFR